VFGYFIEVTKSNLASVPGHYTRKQTTVGGERFITPELKEMEAKFSAPMSAPEISSTNFSKSYAKKRYANLDRFNEPRKRLRFSMFLCAGGNGAAFQLLPAN